MPSPIRTGRKLSKRDPGDVRVNTALGIDAIKAGRFAEAEQYLRKALERATDRYTSPKDGEPFYYLGLALKAQGKTDDAFERFAKATWSGAWRNAGYFEMAQIASLRGDFRTALTYANNSLNANGEDIRALALQSALLRHAGQTDAALAAAAAIRKIDPLDVHALAEQWMAAKRRTAPSCSGRPAMPTRPRPSKSPRTISTRVCGRTARRCSRRSSRAPPTSPRSRLWSSTTWATSPRNSISPSQAAQYFQKAAQAPTDYVFPFQMEMISVLEAAMAANPNDSRAPYYLGNLLYDWQPDRAVALWEKSVSLGADFPVVYRNLALIYTRQGNQRDKALAALEKAASFGGNAMVFNELDKLYEENGVAPEKRLALMETHQSVINRDEVISREINLAIFAGKADLALQLIKSRFFRAWEGGGRFSLGDSWVNANLSRGHQHFAAKRYKDALANYQAALQTPSNLQESSWQHRGSQGRGLLLDRKRLRSARRPRQGPSVVARCRGGSPRPSRPPSGGSWRAWWTRWTRRRRWRWSSGRSIQRARWHGWHRRRCSRAAGRCLLPGLGPPETR